MPSTTCEITVRVRFEFAHRLLFHEGKCNNVHGHSGIAWITFSGEIDGKTAMVADFGDIKTPLQDWVDKHWDHAIILNKDDAHLHNAMLLAGVKTFILPEDPTMEMLALTLYNVVSVMIEGGTIPTNLDIVSVKIQETENAFVEYAPGCRQGDSENFVYETENAFIEYKGNHRDKGVKRGEVAEPGSVLDSQVNHDEMEIDVKSGVVTYKNGERRS